MFPTTPIRLFLQKKRKEKGYKKDEAALDRLEEDLKQEAERLGLPLDQKTKAMKQREKKVPVIMLCKLLRIISHYL